MATRPISDIIARWNQNTTLTAVGLNVEDTLSSTNSKLLNLQVNSSSKFSVDKTGTVNASTISGSNVKVTGTLTAAVLSATGFTGSISGSNFIKNDPSSVNYMDVVFVNGPGKQSLRVDTGMFFYDPLNNTLTVDTDIYAGNAFDVIVNTSPSLFATPTNITFGAGAETLTIGNTGSLTYTKFLSNQVQAANFTGSFTGSITGNKAKFTTISGSNVKVTSTLTTNVLNANSVSSETVDLTSLIVSALTGSSGITASVAGASSGKYAKIKIGNQTYKILLYADS